MTTPLPNESESESVVPVIICGGTGTRLWPVSRAQSPKQFLNVAGTGSPTYFQETVRRHSGPLYATPVVVTSVLHAARVRTQLTEIQAHCNIICEPVPRNTGPAVLAAALRALRSDPAAILLVAPSDHAIEGDLDAVVRAALPAARAGRIVLIGIPPERPETGYGYIVDGGPADHGLRRVERFVEKPTLDIAQRLLDEGSAYWASGLAIFRADTIIEEFRRFDPATLNAVEAAMANAHGGSGGLVLNIERFRCATDASTERAVYERSDKLALVAAKIGWSDVGSWTAVYDAAPHDSRGNALQGDVIAVDAERAFVRAQDRLVAVVGLSDVVVVETSDAVLVTRQGSCQGVRSVVSQLLTGDREEARCHRHVEHDWGMSRQLHRTEDCNLFVLKLKRGALLRIPAMPGRLAVLAAGAVEVFDGVSRRLIEPGDTVALDIEGGGRIENVGAGDAEILLVSRTTTIEASRSVPRVRARA